MRTRISIVAVVTLLLASACAPGASPGDSSARAAATPPASTGFTVPPASSTSAGSASAPAALCALEFAGCVIEAGTYSTRPFIHPFTFTIDEPWTNSAAWPHGGEIGPPAGGVVFQWATDVRAQNMAEPIGSAEDLVTILSRLDGFNVADPVPAVIGGVPGVQFDVETSAVVEVYLAIPEDSLRVDGGEKLRYFAVERDGGLVLLILESFQKSTFDDFIARSKPVIDSIAWE